MEKDKNDSEVKGYIEFNNESEEPELTKRQERKRINKLWRKVMDDSIDSMEDQLKMALDIFIAQQKISDCHYSLVIKCKVKFEFE